MRITIAEQVAIKNALGIVRAITIADKARSAFAGRLILVNLILTDGDNVEKTQQQNHSLANGAFQIGADCPRLH